MKCFQYLFLKAASEIKQLWLVFCFLFFYLGESESIVEVMSSNALCLPFMLPPIPRTDGCVCASTSADAGGVTEGLVGDSSSHSYQFLPRLVIIGWTLVFCPGRRDTLRYYCKTLLWLSAQRLKTSSFWAKTQTPHPPKVVDSHECDCIVDKTLAVFWLSHVPDKSNPLSRVWRNTKPSYFICV